MEDNDFPILWVASDSAANAAQTTHYRLVRLKIYVLLGISIVSSISWGTLAELRTLAAAAVAIFLAVGLVSDSILVTRKFDRTWFDSRAIAETVKGQAWLYMMRVAPYDQDDASATAEFLDSMSRALRQVKEIPRQISSQTSGTQITDQMTRVRQKDLIGRRDEYLEGRVGNQRTWYGNKGTWNGRQEFRWYLGSLILQVVTALLAVPLVFNGPISVTVSGHAVTLNPIGVLTTSVASMLTWSQARRFGELSNSYSLISTGLSILEEQARNVTTETELQRTVLDVERTISREHEIWLTRRQPSRS